MIFRNGGAAMALAMLGLLSMAPVAAQDSGSDREREAREAAIRAQREAAQGQQVRADVIDAQLREAEEQLAEAAARVAELSRQRLPDMTVLRGQLRALDRPVLGVTIGDGEEEGPVEGVTVRGVTPGSAAEEAGLHSGDILTAINDESLSASTGAEANRKLLDFMAGVREGDTLEIEFLRDGKSGTVALQPRKAEGLALAFGDRSWQVPIAPLAPTARWFGFGAAGSWGDMEMVSLTAELGRYFGTDKGLLVVRAPEDESLKLRDGDVIQSIDGREPQSVAHAMRILGSYQAGETLEIEIMRDRKRETLSIEVPDDRQGFLWHFEGARPAPVALPPAVLAPRIRVLRQPRPPERRI